MAVKNDKIAQRWSLLADRLKAEIRTAGRWSCLRFVRQSFHSSLLRYQIQVKGQGVGKY
jgi:hypothetical protein